MNFFKIFHNLYLLHGFAYAAQINNFHVIFNRVRIRKVMFYIAVFLLPCYCLEASQVGEARQNYKAAKAGATASDMANKYFPIYKAGFWIERLNNPDELMLAPEQIKELNEAILDENDEMADVTRLENTVSKQDLVEWLLKDPMPQDKNMFNKKGKAVNVVFYKKLLDNMNIEAVKQTNDLVFGVVVKKADMRAFPTDEPVLKSPSAKGFDAFQYSAIYPPQPVALLHKSKDEKWGFFQTSFVRGWIKIDNIAFADNRDDVNPHSVFNIPYSIVITGSRVKVLKQGVGGQGAGGRKKTTIETVPMGTALTFNGEDKNYWVVKFPEKNKQGRLQWIDGYIEKKADAHIGPLAYTKRNVINQAFKILGEGYGWGGMNGLRDCSSFIKDVFATMAINLPRHSSRQAMVGTVLAGIGESSSAVEDINKALDSAAPGITLFGLSGHIMLYLGNINGNYYTLHQLFGYHDKDGFKTVNKAVVTNLELGKGSHMGAILDRIKSVNLVMLDKAN
ncbi:MAG: SH3 domain-containing protein [Deltaproteobacteria bacterium]|nr:SH3 domain-containing protein [Deltaproteobacteria bacterium]